MQKLVGITTGDPNGIGPEIVIKALIELKHQSLNYIPVIFGSIDVLQSTAEQLQLDVRFEPIRSIRNLTVSAGLKFYCFNTASPGKIPAPGRITSQGGKSAFVAIKAATREAQAGRIDAVATAPIHKEALKVARIGHQDHTAMFKQLTNSTSVRTLFITGSLRIFFLTRHIAFREIAGALDVQCVFNGLLDCHNQLDRLGFKSPQIALAALNPHGGEHGLFGDEEDRILKPALRQALQQGLKVDGPIPADAVFHMAKEGRYDAVVSLYHDQGHIAAKTLDFYRTVSLTLGLPFIRTSVDHGTAMDIAGQGIANATSMVEAIKTAVHYG
ncbi:MAG: 4-hydroxythreonine-4-phosphate dehydrogenase PdxA [Caldithrix sp.]|nr:4-hydroxythreonine-4-phosphate dehydrogenase PdxA [Caldithrix sp.]